MERWGNAAREGIQALSAGNPRLEAFVLQPATKPACLAEPEIPSWLNPHPLLFLSPYTDTDKYDFHSSVWGNKALRKNVDLAITFFSRCFMTLNKLPTLLRIWSIKWEQSPVIPVSESPVGIRKRLSPGNLKIQPPWPEDIYNWLLLYTALCRSHMVATFDPSNPKGIRIQWLFPLDELLELIDRLFMSHNRKLRGQSPRAKMDSLRKYFLLNWQHYFYAWWLESTLNRTAVKTHAKCFLITLQKRSGPGSGNGEQMGGSVAGVNRRICANEFLRWYWVSIHIHLLLCISLYVTWMKTGVIWISFSSDVCWAE